MRSFQLLRSARSLRSLPRATAPASFHTSSIRAALGEHHLDQEGRAEKIDTHKKDSVSKAKSGKGEWKPELASQTEENVRADKHDMSMEELQKMGAKKSEKGEQPSGSDSSKKTD